MSWLNRSQQNQVFVSINGDNLVVFAHNTLHILPDFKALQMLVKDENLKKSEVSCAISRRDYELFYIDAPPVPEEEHISAAKFLVRDLLHYPTSEAALDVFKMPAVGTQQKVMVVASKRQRISDIRDTLSEFGLTVIHLTIPEIALANYIKHIPDSEHATALLYQSAKGSHIMITRSGEIQMIRDIGGLKTSFDSSIEDTTLEIQRSLDFFQTALRHPPPNRLLVSWDLNNPSFIKKLTENLTQKVEPLPLLEDFLHLGKHADGAIIAGLYQEAT